MRLLVLIFSLAVSVSMGYADTLNLNYTVTGNGGLSGPLSPISDHPFWWVDSNGPVTGSDLQAAYGYGYTPGCDVDQSCMFPVKIHNGSLLMSTPFTLAAGQSLSIDMMLMDPTGTSAQSIGEYLNVGFALLLQNSQLNTVLYDAEAGGGDAQDDRNNPYGFFPTNSPGADVSVQIPGYNLSGVTLGGTSYDQTGEPGFLPCRLCSIVNSTYTPSAGTYQLVFGAFYDATGGGTTLPISLSVDDVQVLPEPDSLMILVLGVGMAGLFAIRRRVSL